ncbi:ABC transporter ATP-binding protein [Kitasatospora cineracea]|uniref:Peptide/nickel transport system ATP-binding protein n=1 Tax=Kitasatospora cineracea TaxID=88074 RepID=A0A8G1UNY7_9ACTN|nr:ABC transporter ATP-binding protein [Kitasatospora cineracea]ROR46394.1 peptide/nickel transport system ATP-binding protein [Kitasatospora cineracea]
MSGAAAGGGPQPLLEVADLRVRFGTGPGAVRAVDGLSFEVRPGRTLGVAGESGSGKSAAALALLGLHDPRSTTVTGTVRFDGADLLSGGERALRAVRGGRAAMVFQDSLTALHPYYTVGDQVAEAYRLHHPASRRQARRHAVDLLGRVGVPDPAARAADHPHRLSGGTRRRVLLALALAGDPDLLIADEPTAGLDTTTQAGILELLRDLQRDRGTAIVLISHDLAVLAGTAHDVLVVYAGRAVEQAPVRQLFHHPRHPYTQALLRARPRLDGPRPDVLPAVPGRPPSARDLPPGCPFHPRCAVREQAGPACVRQQPALLPVGERHSAACHLLTGPPDDRPAGTRARS